MASATNVARQNTIYIYIVFGYRNVCSSSVVFLVWYIYIYTYILNTYCTHEQGERKHRINKKNMAIDLFLCGPSCKDMSALSSKRKDFAGSYVPNTNGETFGTSGTTYLHGFKQAIALCTSAVTCFWYIYIYRK